MSMGRSTFYYRRSEKRKERDNELLRHIGEVIGECPGYGYRRVTAELKRRGEMANHKRVLRVMREGKLLCRKPKKARVWRSGESGVFPNLIRGTGASAANQIWASDITYIQLPSGFAYLAVILDLYSRKVIGWALSRRPTGGLAWTALQMALSRRRPGRGCIHHSDQGAQYASRRYLWALKANGFRISLSHKGTPGDNARVESFMKTLKCEEIYLWEYRCFDDLRIRIPEFLDSYYNKRRLHSALGYLPPEEFERLAEGNSPVQIMGAKSVQ